MEKEILGFPLYTVSTDSSVRSLITGKILKPQKTGIKCKQYLKVSLRKDGKTFQKAVHRLEAVAFIPNSDNKATVNHKDFNTFNNSIENLEWATYKENEQHKIIAGRDVKASEKDHVKARKVYQYLKDRTTLVKKFDCIMDVARELNISNACSSSIIKVCKKEKHFNTAYGYFWSYVRLK